MSAAVSNVPAPQAGALARRELERTDFEVTAYTHLDIFAALHS